MTAIGAERTTSTAILVMLLFAVLAMMAVSGVLLV